MKLYKHITRIGIAVLLLYAAASEIFRPAPSADARTPIVSSWKVIVKTALATIAAGIILEALGGVSFMASGFYNIAADQPHFEPIRWFLKTASSRSVVFHTLPERIPNLHDPSLIEQGLMLCRKNCQPCHGAPGVSAEQIGRGINPKPPSLVTMGNDWTNLQLFWIVSHGLKMSGMPAFGARLSETDRWAIIAFLRRVVLLSPAEYAHLTAAADAGVHDESLAWISNSDFGLQELKMKGNAIRGRELLRSYGCGTCHTIRNIYSGSVGPPLSNFAERQYIAGLVVNAPKNLVAWIRNPKRFKETTAMPVLNVSTRDAIDIAAYLYTLGSPKRLKVMQQAAGAHTFSLSTGS